MATLFSASFAVTVTLKAVPLTADDGADTVNCVAGPGFTACVKLALVLVAKPTLPLYTAVMLWLPTLSAVVEHVALPVTSATFTQIGVAPSLKVTVPVGVPVAGATGDTVAVKVTLLPAVDGLPLVVSAVVVPARPTTCVMAGLVLMLKEASPL